jgi:MYXO-CTERM domain-containing protein
MGKNNWLQTGASGTAGLTGSILGTAPGFNGAATQDFTLASGSACIGAANTSVAGLPTDEYYENETVTRMYRVRATAMDLGAFEHTTTGPDIGPYGAGVDGGVVGSGDAGGTTGAGEGGVAGGDSGAGASVGAGVGDDASVGEGTDGGLGEGSDAGSDAATGTSVKSSAGCGCRVASSEGAGGLAALGWLSLAAVALGRRRRR